MTGRKPADPDLDARVASAVSESAEHLMRRLAENPSSVDPLEITLLNAGPAPDMAIFDGLPESAPELACLQYLWPWTPAEHAWALRACSGWTRADRDLFAERLGPELPGIHWPG